MEGWVVEEMEEGGERGWGVFMVDMKRKGRQIMEGVRV